jgi:hypothetical protein
MYTSLPFYHSVGCDHNLFCPVFSGILPPKRQYVKRHRINSKKINYKIMSEDFYATLKLISGEELFSIVTPHKENGKNFLLLYEPVKITEVKNRSNISGYMIESWLKFTGDDLFLIEKDKIITVSECTNSMYINYYKKYLKEKHRSITDNPNEEKLTREQGYISNIDDMKNILEKIYKGPNENNPPG